MNYPSALPHTREFAVFVAGKSAEVLDAGPAAFVSPFGQLWPAGNPVPIRVELANPTPGSPAPFVRPARFGITARASEAGGWEFEVPAGAKVSVEFEGRRRLFLWLDGLTDQDHQPPAGPVRRFSAGRIYEADNLDVQDGETIVIERGAVLRGRLHVKNRQNITLCGAGIFDGSLYRREDGHMIPSIFFERCENVVVADLTMIRPSGWMLLLGACRGVSVRNLKQIGEVISSDGIDIVGSRDVHISGCFHCVNDDCVAVKALDLGSNNLTGVRADLRECPENILVEGGIHITGRCGNSMEIGHELAVDSVRDVTFRDIDILEVGGFGAAFAIHAYDRASVEEVTFEDIRVEHCYDKFIDLRISRSRYSQDATRGRIRGVHFRNIHWTRTPYNAGYTSSIIGGWDAAHRVEMVTLENVFLDGQRVTSPDDLEIYLRHADPVCVIG